MTKDESNASNNLTTPNAALAATGPINMARMALYHGLIPVILLLIYPYIEG